MREYIKESDYDSYFQKIWRETKREFLKCETRQYYNESGEEEFLALHRAGKNDELRDMLERDVKQDNSIWTEAQNRNIDFIRVHVITDPISEYLKFEFEAYKVQSTIGKEKIWIIPLRTLGNIGESEIIEFMLFDENIAMIPNYDKDGKIESALITNELNDIKKLILLKRHFLKVGIEFNEFISRINA